MQSRLWPRRPRMPLSESRRASREDPELAGEKPSPATQVTPQEVQFLEAVSGTPVDSDQTLSLQQHTWLNYVRQQLRSYPTAELRDLLAKGQRIGDGLSSANALTAECLSLLTGLAKMTAVEPQLSIDKAVRLLSDSRRQHLRPEAAQEPLRNRARSLVFCCISWITMLYSTSFQPDFDNLHLNHAQCPSIVHIQPSDNADSPLCELLQEFGPLLPVKDVPVLDNVADPVFSANSLYVSLLNAATLTHLGGIQIEWIDNISSHLQFDPEARRLLIFRLPSFCDVHRYRSVVLSKILNEYYDEFNRPRGFAASALLKEIRQSYQLIFADAYSSRHFYTSKEMRRLREFGPIDPYLNELCGVSSRATRATRATNERNSYSKTTDFPILAARLSVLQDYILRQNPNSLRMIWRDKRNSYQWWTFWAVVVIGCFGILLSLVQTMLSAMQVYHVTHPVK